MAEKVDEENEVICLVFMFSSWVMVLKLSEKVHFLRFCADLSTKSKSIWKQFTYMHLKGLVRHFQKMVMFIVQWLTVLEILGFKSKKLMQYLLSQHLFYILIANILWTTDTCKPFHFLKECNENIQMHKCK